MEIILQYSAEEEHVDVLITTETKSAMALHVKFQKQTEIVWHVNSLQQKLLNLFFIV